MAFIRANFAPIGNSSKKGIGGAPAAWSYKTADAQTVVRVAGYFNEVRDLLSIGDEIRVVVVTNLGLTTETLSAVFRTCVKDKSTTTVDVTDGVTEAVTDTD